MTTFVKCNPHVATPFVGTHFNRSCLWVRWSGRVCLVQVAVGRGAPWPTFSSLGWGGGPFFKALSFFGGARFIAWHLRHSFLVKCRRARGIFGAARRVWATALRPDPPKNVLVPHSSGWWDMRQIPTFVECREADGCVAIAYQ